VRHWFRAVLFSILAIIACTLFPFNFFRGPGSPSGIADALLIAVGPDRGFDVLSNILLFLPLGFTLTGFLEHAGVGRRISAAAVLGVSFWLSYSVEVLQLFLPGRYSSQIDVASNVAGGKLGFFCCVLWYRHIARPAGHVEKARRLTSSPSRFR